MELSVGNSDTRRCGVTTESNQLITTRTTVVVLYSWPTSRIRRQNNSVGNGPHGSYSLADTNYLVNLLWPPTSPAGNWARTKLQMEAPNIHDTLCPFKEALDPGPLRMTHVSVTSLLDLQYSFKRSPTLIVCYHTISQRGGFFKIPLHKRSSQMPLIQDLRYGYQHARLVHGGRAPWSWYQLLSPLASSCRRSSLIW